jgi:hypothetical protein
MASLCLGVERFMFDLPRFMKMAGVFCCFYKSPLERVIAYEKTFLQKGVMLSSVEAWWASLCARPFDGAQGDTPFLDIICSQCLLIGYYS